MSTDHEGNPRVRCSVWLGGWLYYAYLLCENLWLRFLLALAQLETQYLIFLIGFRERIFKPSVFRTEPRLRRRSYAFELKKLFSFGHWFHNGGNTKPPNDKSSPTATKGQNERET